MATVLILANSTNKGKKSKDSIKTTTPELGLRVLTDQEGIACTRRESRGVGNDATGWFALKKTNLLLGVFSIQTVKFCTRLL